MGKVYAIIKLLLVALIIISTVTSLNTEKLKAYDIWLTIKTVTNFVSLILFVFDAVVTIVT